MTKLYPNEFGYAIILRQKGKFLNNYQCLWSKTLIMLKPFKIACIGEVMIEIIARQNGQAKIGVAGDTYNTAVYLSQISNADHLEVSYITALGTDTFSTRILSEINRYNISTKHIELREDHMPGLYAIETDENGERSFSYWRGQAAAKTLFQEPCKIKLQSILEFDLVYISGISMAILPPETRSLLIEFLMEYRSLGGKLAFDSNYRPRLWETIEVARKTTSAMWSITDIGLPSLDDEMLLFGDMNEAQVLKRLIDAGVSYGALKRGDKGPIAIGETVCSSSFSAIENVVDTTAAGDSFNSGFLAEYASDKGLSNAMQTGHKLAAQVIQSNGAIIEINKSISRGT